MKILNAYGFSLTEILISVGLLSAVGLGIVSLSKTQKDKEVGMTGVSEMTRNMNTLKELVGDPKACEYNFKNKNVGSRLNNLKNAQGVAVVKVGDLYNKNLYKIAAIEIGNHNSSTNRTEIKFTFDNIADSTRAKTTTKMFGLFSKVSGSTISECLDPIALAAEGAKQIECVDVDPMKNGICDENIANIIKEMKQFYCTNHPFLEYDSMTGKCKPLDANKACAGKFVQGYDAQGKLICYAGP